jgi:tRNA nucleotidyltransferase (CCA-adding enzyme)
LRDYEAVLRRVLSKIKPDQSQRDRVMATVTEAMEVMRKSLSRVDPRLQVRLEGSLAKDTWITSDIDADVFILFPPSYEKQRMGEIVIERARRAFGENRVRLRYAEHPYSTVKLKDVDIDFVPCFKSTPPNWLSATDRTVYHTIFVNENLGAALKDEARMFKAFLKGIDVYGAEIKVEGFSGFLSELLILWAGGFLEALRKLSEVKIPLVVDVKGLTAGRDPAQVASAFRSDFVVIDPVDSERNVASSVSPDNLANLVWASRSFLAKPSESFFFPKKTRPSLKPLRGHEVRLICVKAAPWDVPPDVLWGQVHRIRRKIEGELVRAGFNVLRSADWTDESREVILLFALDRDTLPGSLMHVGPSAFDYPNSEAFLAKQRSNKRVVSGPFIKDERWVVILRRDHVRADETLRATLCSKGFLAGLSPNAARSFKRARIMCDESLTPKNVTEEGLRMVAEFLAGRPRWM